MARFERILCPTDFSETSARSFELAEELAAELGAALVLLHVFDMPDFWGTGGETERVDAELKRELTAIRPTSEKVPVEYAMHAGLPGEVICWVAQERKCDLIVLGTHGRTGAMHLLLGSVAEYVMKHARCPVLTARQRPADEEPLPEPKFPYHVPPIV